MNGILVIDDSQGGYTNQFTEQGYSSKQLITNISQNFMNLITVLMVTAFVKACELGALHFRRYCVLLCLKKLYRRLKVIDFMKGVLIYNFLLQTLLENSLQFILFSMINVLQVSTK